MKVNWEGVMPAMTTAFTEDDRLDLDTLGINLRAQLNAGVSGIILGGTLGEASTLSEDEKGTLVQFAVGELRGSIPVICNIAEQATAAAVRAAQLAEKQGAQGLMLLPPMRYRATDREVIAYFEAVARETSLPVMIYNNPVDYRIEVTPGMFEVLLKHENIQAVKESTRDITNIHRLKDRFGDRLRILCGVDTLALESFLMGAHGWVAGLVCAFPAETVAIYQLAMAGRVQEALIIYRWFMPLLELDLSPQLVQNIKLAETFTGLGTEFVRLPRMPLQGKDRQAVLDLLDDRLRNRPEIPDIGQLKGQNH